MDPPARDPAGVAGRGDTRRDHAEALHLRGNRRHRRRDDDEHPGSADSGRNWDYRYCWLRDAFFVVRALNSLSEVDTMEHYLRYLANIVGQAPDGHLQPVYGIALERTLEEREIPSLAGYRGMRPVRVGNQAFEHLQHDVYGNVVLASAQSFFDRRLLRPATAQDFVRLERVGEQAYRVYATADASMWELRTRERVHTSSALMCWAACDRLARIAAHRALPERSRLWQDRAAEIRGAIEERAFDAARGSFMESFGGNDVEAGLLLMAEVGFLPPDDPRFAGTVDAIEKRLRRGRHLFRYAAADDFGMPTTAFNICTFWYIDALARLGRRDEARELFGLHAREPQPCRSALGRHRAGKWRALGQLSADLLAGRDHQRGDAALALMGGVFVKRQARLVAVSNRVGPVRGAAAAGGLAVGLVEALHERGGLWFGWSGRTAAAGRARLHTEKVDGMTLATLDLTQHELDGYYNGF